MPLATLIDDRPPPVEHRMLGLDRRKLVPTLAVLALVVFWAGVVPAIDEAISADEIKPGTVYEVNLGTSFEPAAGWVVSGVPLPSLPSLTVFDSGVEFKISAGPFEGTATELLDTIRDLRDDLEFEGDAATLATASGIPGAAVEFIGAKDDGALFAFVATAPEGTDRPTNGASSVGIQVVVKGPPDALQDHTEDVGRMVASINVDFGGGQS